MSSNKKNAKYAEGTDVPVHTSQLQLRNLVDKNGGRYFSLMSNGLKMADVVIFALPGEIEPPLFVKFEIIRPDNHFGNDKQITAEERRLWRSLILIIKSCFECANTGFTSIEQAFFGFICTKDNKTVFQTMMPQLLENYKNNSPIKGLLG